MVLVWSACLHVAGLAGLLLLARGYFRRRGSEHVCAACGYLAAPGLRRCPECGEPWNVPGDLRRGVPARSKSMIIGGGALVAGWLASLTLVDHDELQLQLTPTATLVGRLERTGLSDREVRELFSRRSFKGALADRAAIACFSKADLASFSWIMFQNAMVDGTVGSETRERIFESSVREASCWPERRQARVGDLIPCWAAVERADHTLFPLPMLVSDVRVSGPAEILPAGQDPPPWRSPSQGPAIATAIRPTSPGTIRVEVTIWFAAFAPGAVPTWVDWTEDRTPLMSQGWLWAKPRTFVVTISAE